ncbi:MAG: segregation/condensation protein A [Elusimicrobiota bacterium]
MSNNTFMEDNNYQIKLENFEGPMDLLIYLIKRDDIDIYDIPIAKITEEYLRYVEMIKMLKLDTVGEFLVMAATLMQIKAQMLLPRPQVVDGDETGPDPREELIRKLLEYEKYKQVALVLDKKEDQQYGVFYRQNMVLNDEDYSLEVSLFDLLAAFKKVVEETSENVKEIVYDEIPLDQRIREIIAMLESKEYLVFSDLFVSNSSKAYFIVTFLAVLELVKERQLAARQNALFGEIRVYKVVASETKPADTENQGSDTVAVPQEKKDESTDESIK